MPLKTQLCDSHGQVIEQILFARLDMPENIPDSDLAPAVHTEACAGCARDRRTTLPRPAVSGYRASELPPGFRLTVAGAQTIGERRCPATSPGVFGRLGHGLGVRRARAATPRRAPAARSAGAAPSPPMQGLARVGSGFAFSTVVQGHQVTAVGEVPAADRRVHRPLGEVFRRRRPAAPHWRSGAAALCDVFAAGLRPVRGDVGGACGTAARRVPGRCARRRCDPAAASPLRPQDSGAAAGRRAGVPRASGPRRSA